MVGLLSGLLSRQQGNLRLPIRERGKMFFFCQFNGYLGSYPGVRVKEAGRNADHSPASSDNVNALNDTCTPSHVCMLR
jgi:hypothetical protein